MRKAIFTLIFLSASLVCYSQDFRGEYLKAVRDNNILEQEKLISYWQKADSLKSDYYFCAFDYYINHPDNEHYMYYALDIINKGIDKYPNNIELRLKKISALLNFVWVPVADKDNNAHKEFLGFEYANNEMIKVVDNSYIIGCKWNYLGRIMTCSDITAIFNDYHNSVLELIEKKNLSNDDKQKLEGLKKVELEIEKYFPDNSDNYKNLSEVYNLLGDKNNYEKYSQKVK